MCRTTKYDSTKTISIDIESIIAIILKRKLGNHDIGNDVIFIHNGTLVMNKNTFKTKNHLIFYHYFYLRDFNHTKNKL